MPLQPVHGGDILSAKLKFPGDILDFSVNINPLGVPSAVLEAIADSAHSAHMYPDPFCRQLSAGIADKYNVSLNRVLCGNGAADLIFRILFALRPANVLLTAPTFAEYQLAANAAGCTSHFHFLSHENNYILTDSYLDDLTPDINLAFLCNPNNPTGQIINPDLMMKIIAKSFDLGITLVIDECFIELTDYYEKCSVVKYIGDFTNIVVLNAFTKTYAIPGVRLGFCFCSDSRLLDKLTACAQPWSVSNTAIAAGLACLQIPDHPATARDFISTARPFLCDDLKSTGLTVFPSQANYILFRAQNISQLRESLLSQGILIRSCANYVNLAPDYYRVAVRSYDDNSTLISALKKI